MNKSLLKQIMNIITTTILCGVLFAISFIVGILLFNYIIKGVGV